MRLLPRSVERAFEQARRDATMVARRVAGKAPPPFTTRSPRNRGRHDGDVGELAARAAAVLAPRTVRVARVVRETDDAVTLVFEDPSAAPFHFVAGQFFTILVPIGGEILRRAYSASSDARDHERVAVTVKRVAGGVVSNYLNDKVREGDLLQVLGPSGSFTVPSEAAGRHLVLLAGGSGITPFLSIARTALGASPATRLTLICGNRGERDIIFRAALDELSRAHAPRFTLRHVLAAPPPDWTGGVGIMDESTVGAELAGFGPLDDAHFFLCGPEPMMRACRVVLGVRGVTGDRIAEERFTMPHLRDRARAALASAGPQILTIRRGGAAEREVYVGAEQTILEAGLSAGVPLDYSCAMGGCGACRVRLLDGDVEMEEPNCLTAAERGAGYVLACVGRLRTAATIQTTRQGSSSEATLEGSSSATAVPKDQAAE